MNFSKSIKFFCFATTLLWLSIAGAAPCIRHAFVSTAPDAGGTVISSDEWNACHSIIDVNAGEVIFGKTGNAIEADSNFVWDDTNKLLKLGADVDAGDDPNGGTLQIRKDLIGPSGPYRTVHVKNVFSGGNATTAWGIVVDTFWDGTNTSADPGSISAFLYRGNQSSSARTAAARGLESQVFSESTAADPIYGLEIGVHTNQANTEAHGIFLWSGDLTPVSTAYRAGDALRIWGNKGWNRAMLYVDTDNTTPLFAIGSDGTTLAHGGFVADNLAATGAAVEFRSAGNTAAYMNNNSGVFRIYKSGQDLFYIQTDGPSAGQTAMWLYYYATSGLTMGQVLVGAADSCTAGYRCLRVAN